MFEFVRTHTRLLQFVLVLLIFPSFVFFGVQGYSRFLDKTSEPVAKVDGHKITQGEWERAFQRQIEQIRSQMPGVDVKMFDNPGARQALLESLVRENTVIAAVNKLHLAVSDERLQRIFATDAQFAQLRNADGSVNKELLAAQGMSSEMFAQQLRQQLAMQQVTRGIAGSALVPSALVSAQLDVLLQRREIAYSNFDAQALGAGIKPSEAEIEAHYKAHQGDYQAPEQATIEYVVLDLENLKKSIEVKEADARAYYDSNLPRYTVAEERRARHILVNADKDAGAEVKQKAKDKAEKLLADLRKSPASFQELAKKNSDDTASAAQGGDLGFFKRGDLAAKPVEDAAFAMKPGEISNLVISEFGYHIIQLETTRGGDKKSFDSVRSQIEDEIRRQQASKLWAEKAEQFRDMAYEQSDSLQPVIDKFKLDKRSATVQRTPAQGATGALASAKLLDAVFSADSLQKKRNTDAVEVGSNQMAAAHVVQHSPAHTRALAEVREAVRAAVVTQQAAALARKQGEALLAHLRSDGPKADLSNRATVSRNKPEGLSRAALEAVLAADAGKLPAYVGVDNGQAGFWVGRIDKVLPRELPANEQERMATMLKQSMAQAEEAAYIQALKARFKAEIMVAPAAPDAAAAGANEAAR